MGSLVDLGLLGLELLNVWFKHDVELDIGILFICLFRVLEIGGADGSLAAVLVAAFCCCSRFQRN